MSVLVRELTELYTAFVQRSPGRLPELPIQYADFAHWQRQYLRGEVMDGLLAYWTRQLAGAPRLLELPSARPRPLQQDSRGATRSRTVPASLSRELERLGRLESASLFMVLLAAFKALLHARTGAADLVIGTDVAGRNQLETEPLIGFFVNQLALRTSLGGDPTFRELLGRVRETALAAYAHQDMPFDRLVEALAVPRSLRWSPVFQIKLVLQNAPESRLDLPELTLRPIELERTTSQLDMNLRVIQQPEGLLLALEHSTDLYTAEMVDWLLEQLEFLLGVVVARPEARLGELTALLVEADHARNAERSRKLWQISREKRQVIKRQASTGG